MNDEELVAWTGTAADMAKVLEALPNGAFRRYFKNVSFLPRWSNDTPDRIWTLPVTVQEVEANLKASKG